MKRMRMSFRKMVLMAAFASCTGASAHHSSSQFDVSEGAIKRFSGTVKEFKWHNPHIWIWLNVPGEGGRVDLWGLEMASPGSLRLSGLNWNSIRAGDKITVDVAPSRNGTRIGIVAGRILLADGTVWVGTGSATPVQGRYRPDGSRATGGAVK